MNMTRRSLALLTALALGLALVACTHTYGADQALTSFTVRVTTPVEALGTTEAPLPFVSGQMCAADGSVGCPAGQTCVPFCQESGDSCASDDDCPGSYELCIGACTTKVRLTVEAVGAFDDRVPFTGFLSVQAIPGFVPPPKQVIKMTEGVAEDVEIFFARGVGETRFWVEDTGFRKSTTYYGECNDGKDNDGNGLFDLADPGCDGVDDGVEHSVTGVAGVSDLSLVYENPRIRHLQWTSAVATSSPLQGQEVRIDRGRFVVTNVTSTGLFVTDLEHQVETLPTGEPGYYNSIFLYTWTTPDNVSYGDALCWMSGGVVEHEGNTQVKFPSFWTYFGADDPECAGNPLLDPEAKVPDPVNVTGLIAKEDPQGTNFALEVNANSRALEPFESSLVTVENLQLSTRFLGCDANLNGEIDAGTDEESCRTVCQDDPLCTELSSFFKYKQYAAYVDGKKKMNLSGEMLLEFTPLRIEFVGQEDQAGRCAKGAVWIGNTRVLEYSCPERHLDRASGNLRHLFLCPKTWDEDRCELQFHTIVPRFDEDIVETVETADPGETP